MLLLGLSAAFAAPMDPIAQDLQAGAIDEHEALWQHYLRHFEPDQARPDYALVEHEDWSCSTGLVKQLKLSWDHFSPAEQAQIGAKLSPWSGELLDPFGNGLVDQSASAGMAPPPENPDTCFGQYGSDRLFTEHFSVEWESGVSRSDAEAFGEALEEGYDGLVNDLGWRPVINDDRYYILAYIAAGDGSGAYTTVANCTNGGWMPYIVTWESVFDWGTWYIDMAPHELNHAQQFTYGSGHEFWWWEATATYIEEDVHPRNDAWSSYVQTGYTEQPWIGMRQSSQDDQQVFWHMYGMAVWGFYLAEHVGGHELVRETWEYVDAINTNRDMSMESVLEGMGEDFDSIYKGFMAANTVFDYADSREFGDITLADRVRTMPADGGDYGGLRPQSLGQAYIHFNPNLADGSEPDLLLNFNGEAGGDWAALLVGTSGSSVELVVELELDDGQGEGRLPGMQDFDDVWLVASPMASGGGAWDFEWDADTVQPLEVDEPDPEDSGGDGGVERPTEGGGPLQLEPTGCGCSAQSSGSAPAWMLLMGLLVFKRRR